MIDQAFVAQAFIAQAFIDQAFIDQAFIDQAFIDQAFDRAVVAISPPSFNALSRLATHVPEDLFAPRDANVFPAKDASNRNPLSD